MAEQRDASRAGLLESSEVTELGREVSADREEEDKKIAVGKAVRVLNQLEQSGQLQLQKDSVYGAVIAMPQLARSTGWNVTFTALALRSLLLYLINIMFQFFLAYMVYVAGNNISAYAGKMHLCSFGVKHQQCPDVPNCYGPGGTEYTPERLYSFDIWSTRNFVRDSLIQLFPDMKHDIESKVDPGEYGLESLYCRLICAFIFCMVVMDDLTSTLELCRLLWYVPTAVDPWVEYTYATRRSQRLVSSTLSKDQVKEIRNIKEVDLVNFKVVGIPVHWKLIYFFGVVVPKLMIWKAVAYVGVYFLLETAGIMDLIINTTALAFLLSLDETIMAYFGASSMLHVMDKLQGLDLEPDKVENESDADVVGAMERSNMWSYKSIGLIVPKQLAAAALLLLVFVFEYYHSNCMATEDGSMISKNIRRPHRVYRWYCMFMRCHNEDGDIMWTMPNVSYPYEEM